jgi:hypothetical protein
MPKLITYAVFGFCYFMCIFLSPVRGNWLLFVSYLIRCKIGFGGPYVKGWLILKGVNRYCLIALYFCLNLFLLVIV